MEIREVRPWARRKGVNEKAYGGGWGSFGDSELRGSWLDDGGFDVFFLVRIALVASEVVFARTAAAIFGECGVDIRFRGWMCKQLGLFTRSLVVDVKILETN